MDSVVCTCPSCGARNRIPRGRISEGPICGKCKSRLFAGAPVVATDATFSAEVEGCPIPTLVDFWAPWCGPCRTIAPALEEIARERAGSLKVVKVNVDENPAVAGRFGIRSIPALKLFRGKELLEDIVGAVPKAQLLSRIEPHL